MLIFSWLCLLPVDAVQVTEVMYNPPGETRKPKKVKYQVDTSAKNNGIDYEFIELYNEKADRLDLGQWHFTRGIKLQFSEGTIIEPRTYFLVAKNPKKLKLRINMNISKYLK